MKTSPYTILYEDEDILVVYKQRNVFTIATDDKKTIHYNLYHYLYLYLRKKKEKPYLVHRLDYETSGILVFAKKEDVQIRLRKSFEERKPIRLYEAVIKEEIPLQRHYEVRQYLAETSQGKVYETGKEEGKEAITLMDSINRIQIGTALRIEILTGRKNQIRMAIHSLGFTLLGDKRYSDNTAKRMYLNAYALILPPDLGLRETRFVTSPLWILPPEKKE